MRAQTTLDFAIGVSVFLVSVAAVFTFAPGLVDPFATGNQADPVVANRAAASLAGDELADAEQPFILETAAVTGFFDDAAGDQAYVRSTLGLDDRADVNVTLRDDDGVLLDPGGNELQVGPPPSDRADVSVAWRVVSYRGSRAELVVRVW